MIDLAVQEFEYDRHACVLCVLLDAIQTDDAVLLPLLVGHARAIAGERDYVGHLVLARELDQIAEIVLQALVTLFAIPSVGNSALTLRNGRHEAVLLDRRPVLQIHQVDAAKSDLGSLPAEIVERD